jgi:hypothetical protein
LCGSPGVRVALWRDQRERKGSFRHGPGDGGGASTGVEFRAVVAAKPAAAGRDDLPGFEVQERVPGGVCTGASGGVDLVVWERFGGVGSWLRLAV